MSAAGGAHRIRAAAARAFRPADRGVLPAIVRHTAVPPALALLATLLAAVLTACGPSSPGARPDAPRQDAVVVQLPPDPAPLDRLAAGEAPFPEARDTLRFEVPVSDTVKAFFRQPRADTSAFARPGDSLGGPVLGRPDRGRQPGIRLRPRPADLPAHVRVLLTRTARPLAVYSLGDAEIRGDAGGRPEVLRGRMALRRDGGAFEVSQANRTVFRVAARRLRVISLNPYNLLEVGGQVYRGHLEIIASASGELAVVNVLGLEDYLRGVLPYELGTVERDALEALKAMAVAARTYACKRMLANQGKDFHVHADVQDQVYKGVKGEYLLSDRAIRETRGMTLTYRDTLVTCYYHSTCGGRTAARHEVWGGDSIPYLVPRPDLDAAGQRYCRASRYSEWRQEWSLPQLAGILKRNLPSAGVASFPAFGAVQRLETVSLAACGRIRLLRIVTDKGDILVKGDKVRWALRPAGAEERILPSAWFDVKVVGGRVLAEGRAFGHGVGLCQFGTIARAKAGQDFRAILTAYYAGTELVEFR